MGSNCDRHSSLFTFIYRAARAFPRPSDRDQRISTIFPMEIETHAIGQRVWEGNIKGMCDNAPRLEKARNQFFLVKNIK